MSSQSLTVHLSLPHAATSQSNGVPNQVPEVEGATTATPLALPLNIVFWKAFSQLLFLTIDSRFITTTTTQQKLFLDTDL